VLRAQEHLRAKLTPETALSLAEGIAACPGFAHAWMPLCSRYIAEHESELAASRALGAVTRARMMALVSAQPPIFLSPISATSLWLARRRAAAGAEAGTSAEGRAAGAAGAAGAEAEPAEASSVLHDAREGEGGAEGEGADQRRASQPATLGSVAADLFGARREGCAGGEGGEGTDEGAVWERAYATLAFESFALLAEVCPCGEGRTRRVAESCAQHPAALAVLRAGVAPGSGLTRGPRHCGCGDDCQRTHRKATPKYPRAPSVDARAGAGGAQDARVGYEAARKHLEEFLGERLSPARAAAFVAASYAFGRAPATAALNARFDWHEAHPPRPRPAAAPRRRA